MKKHTLKKLRDDKEHLKLLLRHARIPPLYWGATVEASSASISGFAKNLKDNMKRGTGLILTGPHGVGKTYQACALAKLALGFTARVLYISAPDLVQAYIHQPMFDEDLTMAEALINRRLLVIDDLGQEYRGSGSGHSEQRILSLIRHRIQYKASTVLTTNMSIDQMETTYGAGLVSLFREGLVIVQMKGSDRRMDPEARAQLLDRSGVKG